ncbi:MAG TPA: twin-arginine translocation signal domain-containing protein, partial [Daejeonella sp.]|nr:twin-arginine translocation signal domain-containing protein [Daejeonella sp.]
MNRRDFIKNSSLASAGAILIPSFLKPFEAMALGQLSDHKNLVIIQLSGGNDGLNTVVPYGMDTYYQKRRTISVPASEIIKLNELQGLNPAISALREIYDQGWMSIINSVGYPNPDRSHFRSMDIWQTASDSNQFLSTGWIGRYL